MSFMLLCYYACLFCLIPSTIAAHRNENITLGEWLMAGNESSSSWVSPSGDFAFGFKQVGSSGSGGFLLAIWFNKIPEKTVTWSANRDALAQPGSKVQLTEGGMLVLSDPSGTQMWSPPAIAGAAYASMLDTGNFMLAHVNSDALWQSFDTPTDTILPTQIMWEDTALVSRISDTNYSSGRFQLQLQLDGNFVFYMIFSPKKSDHYLPAYDATNTMGDDHQVVFNQSGSIYVVQTDSGALQATVLQDTTDPELYYQRAILEFDGVFSKYVYPRSSSKPAKWTMTNLRPQDICSKVHVTSGTGLCGFNTICQTGYDQMQRPTCKCLPEYTFLDLSDQMRGCRPNFAQHSCSEDSQEDSRFQLKEIPNIDFQDSPYQIITGASELLCQNSCLSDCFCAVVVSDGDTCSKIRSPIINGWVSPNASISTKVFIKIGIRNSTTTSTGPIVGVDKAMEHQTVIIIESVFLGSSVFLNILLLLTVLVLAVTFCSSKSKPKTPDDHDIVGTNIRNFGYTELEEATNGFKEVVGQGAFATVYKGLLDSEEGSSIAVKKLNEMCKENQREFENEVKAIARTGHRNLVRLIGFCNEGQHRLLVYEYMRNGSLAENLLQDQKPSLSRRMKFALETAKGLNYLHEECSIQIIHCDIKLQNVLLDDSFTARISDFGLAKLLNKDQAHTMTGIRGTKGYVAPEWFKSVPVTTKVDVYSYGILLLELICCRRCFEPEKEDESQMVLADWAYDCYNGGRIDKLVEGDNEALANPERIEKLVVIALRCIQEDPVLRPSMNKVVQMIKEALEEFLSPHNGPLSVDFVTLPPSTT